MLLSTSSEPRQKVSRQIVSGIKKGLAAGFFAYSGLWLGARAIQTVRDISNDKILGHERFSLKNINLPEQKLLRDQLKTNSTQEIYEAICGQKYIDGKLVFDSSLKISKSQIVQKSHTFIKLLEEVSPSLSGWYENQWKKDRVEIIDLAQTGSSATTVRYHQLTGNIELFPSFFSLTDAEKIVVLAHEYEHAKEDVITVLSDRFTPQILVGYLTRNITTSVHYGIEWLSKAIDHPPAYAQMEQTDLTGRQKTANRLDEINSSFSYLSGNNGWPYHWSYHCDPSEQRALKAENRAAKILNLDIWHHDHNTKITNTDYDPKRDKLLPGQEVLVLFGSSALIALRKRRKALNTAR